MSSSPYKPDLEPKLRKYVIIHKGGRLVVQAVSVSDARIKADRKAPGIHILAIREEE